MLFYHHKYLLIFLGHCHGTGKDCYKFLSALKAVWREELGRSKPQSFRSALKVLLRCEIRLVFKNLLPLRFNLVQTPLFLINPYSVRLFDLMKGLFECVTLSLDRSINLFTLLYLTLQLLLQSNLMIRFQVSIALLHLLSHLVHLWKLLEELSYWNFTHWMILS